jgi:hypothetical protein
LERLHARTIDVGNALARLWCLTSDDGAGFVIYNETKKDGILVPLRESADFCAKNIYVNSDAKGTGV